MIMTDDLSQITLAEETDALKKRLCALSSKLGERDQALLWAWKRHLIALERVRDNTEYLELEREGDARADRGAGVR